MTYLLDTHVWLWLFEGAARLPAALADLLQRGESVPLGLAAISPWEVAKKVSLGKLRLSIPARSWILAAAANPGIRLLPLTPEICWEANHLPGEFHRDPADQIIAATARVANLTLLTCDRRLLDYPHIRARWA